MEALAAKGLRGAQQRARRGHQPRGVPFGRRQIGLRGTGRRRAPLLCRDAQPAGRAQEAFCAAAARQRLLFWRSRSRPRPLLDFLQQWAVHIMGSAA